MFWNPVLWCVCGIDGGRGRGRGRRGRGESLCKKQRNEEVALADRS